MRKTKKGFTLIEILFVIIIIGIIASMVIISLAQSSKDKARIAKGLSYANSVRAQLSSYEIAWWKFEESSCSGACIKDSWGGYTGTPTNIGFDQVGVGGGKAFNFNSTSYVSTLLNSSSGILYADAANWTTSVWFKYSGTGVLNQVITGAGGGIGSVATYAVWVTSAGELKAKFRGNPDNTIATNFLMVNGIQS